MIALQRALVINLFFVQYREWDEIDIVVPFIKIYNTLTN